MKITINLTKREMNHIYQQHTFWDSCDEVSHMMTKLQKEVRKVKDGSNKRN